jgi:hypothetical protein
MALAGIPAKFAGFRNEALTSSFSIAVRQSHL